MGGGKGHRGDDTARLWLKLKDVGESRPMSVIFVPLSVTTVASFRAQVQMELSEQSWWHGRQFTLVLVPEDSDDEGGARPLCGDDRTLSAAGAQSGDTVEVSLLPSPSATSPPA